MLLEAGYHLEGNKTPIVPKTHGIEGEQDLEGNYRNGCLRLMETEYFKGSSSRGFRRPLVLVVLVCSTEN